MVNFFKILRLFTALIGAVASTGLNAVEATQWIHDLDRIVADIRARHPDPWTKVGDLTFRRAAGDLREAMPSLTEEQRLVRLMQLVASLGDGHTQLEPAGERFAWWYPIRVYEFSDGYFVTAACSDVAELAGAELLEIAGRPVAEVAHAARSVMGADNAMQRMENLFYLSHVPVMRGLGYAGADGALAVRVRLTTGTMVERTLTPRPLNDRVLTTPANSIFWRFRPEVTGPPIARYEDWISAFRGLSYAELRTPDATRPHHLIKRPGVTGIALPEQSAFFIQVNGVRDYDGRTFLQIFQGWLAEIDRLKPRRLIIDIRYNTGGDGSVIPPVIHEFIAREKNPPWKDVYVLTGRRTFSAGIMLLDALLDHVPLSVVGEPAGAALNHYGDATSIDYPGTGLHLQVSTLRHQLSESNDLAEYTPVDVPAPFSFADYAAGRDPAVDAILRGDEMRSIPIIARKDGGAAARAAWQERREALALCRWWRRPTELVMRAAADSLIAEGRIAEAIECGILTTELQPQVWNSWYGLGSTLLSAGRKTEAAECFKRVLELDPNNPNKPEIEPLLKEAGR